MPKKQIKIKKRPPTPKALRSPKTRRLAIHAFCRDCIYDPAADGGWRKQVELCTACDTCPLFAFRPMTIAGERARTKSAKAKK